MSVVCYCGATAKVTLPENFEDTTWEKLKLAVEAVHRKKAVNSSLEELYRVRLPFHCSVRSSCLQTNLEFNCVGLLVGSRRSMSS